MPRRKVIVGTPVHAGEFCYLWYVDSLFATAFLAAKQDVDVAPIFVTGELAYARNKIIQTAVETQADDLFFIDSDIGFLPVDFLRMLQYEEEFVSGPYVQRKAKGGLVWKPIRNASLDARGVLEISHVGAGFLRLRRACFTKLWDKAHPYTRAGDRTRAVFEYRQADDMLSEEVLMCRRWQAMRGRMWLDTRVQLKHFGLHGFQCTPAQIRKAVEAVQHNLSDHEYDELMLKEAEVL